MKGGLLIYISNIKYVMKIRLNKKNNENLEKDEIYLEIQYATEIRKFSYFVDFLKFLWYSIAEDKYWRI